MTAFPNDRERDVRAHLKARLKEIGGELRKVKWINRNGAPDELVLVSKQTREHFLVELKAPGETPKPHQWREIRKLRDYGMRVLIIDSREAVDAALRL